MSGVNNKNNNWTLYRHVVPAALSGYDHDKYYIGITSKSVQQRWGKNGRCYTPGTYFYNAIKKYGWDNMLHEILKTGLTEDEAKQLEVEYIAKYNTNNKVYGYNSTKGGDGVVGLHHTAESKAKMSKAKAGKKYSKEHLESFCTYMKERSKNVCMFSLDGELVSIFKSARDASEHTGIKIKSIGNACIEKTSCKGHQWRYEVDLSDEEREQNKIPKYLLKPRSDYNIARKEISQYDPVTGTLIKTYKSARYAHEETKLSSIDAIQLCAKLNEDENAFTHCSGGYVWVYSQQSKEIAPCIPAKARPIVQYDSNMNYVNSFFTVSEAERETGIHTIHNVFSKKDKMYGHMAGGFYWAREAC